MADSPRLARLITGRDRDQVFPDEATNLLARLGSFVLFSTAVACALATRLPLVPFTSVVLGGFLLLTPTLHPWYVLWLVPLVAVDGPRAWLALAALVPLGYEPLGGWLSGAPWRDPIWTRLVEHGLTWALLAAAAKSLTPWKAPLLSDILAKRTAP
jgi:hypothetical protein